MRTLSKPRSRAFTLVELLVVIAIIAVLLSIPVPVIVKARTKAQILASPVVYQTWKDNGYHVTDAKLGWDVRILREPGSAGDRRPGNVVWSPSGQKLGFELSNWSGSGPQYMCILNPLTGELRKFPQMIDPFGPRTYFFGWVDDFTFIENAGRAGKLYLRDATSGAVLKTVPQSSGFFYGPLYNLPPDAPAPFICGAITSWPSASGSVVGVFLVRKDLSLSKPIWICPVDPATMTWQLPPAGRVGVDPTGQWVAWPTVERGVVKTAIKRMDDPVALKPRLISVKDPFGSGYKFVTWIGENQLLHVQQNGIQRSLIVIDRDGNVLRTAEVAEGVDLSDPPAAAWRRFMHY